METITIPKEIFQQMESEINLLKNSNTYQRLLEFEENIKNKKFTRKDIGF